MRFARKPVGILTRGGGESKVGAFYVIGEIMRHLWGMVALGGALVGCNGGESSVALAGPCGDMCKNLVQECGYAAFPTVESCFDGCLYAEEEGADVGAQSTCVETAMAGGTCDTFAIVECEHAHGIF